MKVFACQRQGGYSGGLLIVAANTVEEAFLTAARHKPISYWFYWVDANGWCEDDGNIRHLYSDYYPLSKFYEEPRLTADVTEPQVIAEGGYTE